MKEQRRIIPIAFIVVRSILFLSLPIEGIRGYGDYWNFYHLAELGWPFFDNWVEFPPVYPFLSRLVYLIAGGKQHAFEYLSAFAFTFIQAGNLYLLWKITERIYSEQETRNRIWTYFTLSVGLFYGWAYFDPLAVMTMLLGVYWFMIGKDQSAAVILGVGGLIKWFPLLIIPGIWKKRPPKKALQLTLITFSIMVFVWGGLILLSPEMTKASLASQFNKGSWETIWALIDGNLRTGNFGSEIDRTLPQTAYRSTINPALIPSWLTLILFGGMGLWVLLRSKVDTDKELLSFMGLTLVIFFLWSPGYSPQWVLYVLPFMILLLSWERSILFSLTMILIHVLEWPILLSRGWFDSLWIIIPLRTLLYILLGSLFYREIMKPKKGDKVVTGEKTL